MQKREKNVFLNKEMIGIKVSRNIRKVCIIFTLFFVAD